MENGHIVFTDKNLNKYRGGYNTWSEIGWLISRDCRSICIIPTWRTPDGGIEACGSQQQTQVYDDEVVHQFESRKFDKHVQNPELDKKLSDFQQERLARVSTDVREALLDDLNSPITLNEIRNAIDSSRTDSTAYDDEFSVSYLKQGQELLLRPTRDELETAMFSQFEHAHTFYSHAEMYGCVMVV